MSNWPDKPLIRIIKGYDSGKLREDLIAFKCKDGNSYRGDNCHIVRGYPRDSIDAWEEVAAVPTAHLKALKEAWWGPGGENTKWLRNVEDAMTPILDCLPADKPSPLDRAVTRVKDIEGGRMIDAETLPAERLSLLLDALASIQSATRKTTPLAMVARICADWANMEEPYCDALREIAGRAQSDPTRIDFVGLTAFVGDVAASLDDGTNGGPRNDLLEMGSHALAWAAQIIEEEEK